MRLRLEPWTSWLRNHREAIGFSSIETGEVPDGGAIALGCQPKVPVYLGLRLIYLQRLTDAWRLVTFIYLFL